MSNESRGSSDGARCLSQENHRRLIGFLGFLLPVMLYLVAGLRPLDVLPPWKLLTSVSAYYYTGATGIFVGILFTLGLFLLSYPGYEGEKADRYVGRVAGLAALGVALFPTGAPTPIVDPPWWHPWVRVIHYVSAVTLFLCFILFAGWLFRKSKAATRQGRTPGKRHRDDICLACAIVMGACILWAASALITDASIFLPESIAIMAFAVSWLTKGKAYRLVPGVGRPA